MRRSVLTAALVVVGALPIAGPTASAATGPPGSPEWVRTPLAVSDVTVTPIQFKVTVNTEGAFGQPVQTCDVDADLYVPNTATAAHPAPAILTTNGFGGSKSSAGATASNASYALQYARQGYVTLSYSGLGFGKSTCQIELDSRQYDGEAGAALVDYLGGNLSQAYTTYTKDNSGLTPGSWSGPVSAAPPVVHDGPGDPRLGMIGGSYGGEVQFAVADKARNADGTSKVDALIPQITWNDLAYSLAPNNQVPAGGPTDGTAPVTQSASTPGVEKTQWTSIFTALGAAQLALGNGGAVGQDPTSATNPTPCPDYDPQICPSVLALNAFGFPDATAVTRLQAASVGGYLSRITMPVFLSQGQDDTLFNDREALTTFKALEAQGTPVKMLWQQWGHSGGPVAGEADATANYPQLSDDLRYSAWFAKYLRGDTAADTGPAFEYTTPWLPDNGTDVTGAGTAAEVAGTPDTGQMSGAADYPAGRQQALYLSAGNGSLVTDPASAATGSQTFAASAANSTSYTETSGVDQSQPVRDTPGTFAAFDSPPLAEPADQVGSPTLTVGLSAPSFASTQVSPAGQLVLFAKLYDVSPSGAITLANRVISPVRVTDITKPVTIQLPAIVHRYPAGDHLELVLAQGDTAYNGNRSAGPVSVVTSPDAPGTLSVPFVDPGGAKFAASPGSQVPEVGTPAALVAVGAAVGYGLLRRRRALATRPIDAGSSSS